MQTVINSVVRLTGISLEEMQGRGRTRPVVDARMILAKRLHDAGFSFSIIARLVNRPHTAGQYLVRTYHDTLATDKAFARRFPNEGARVYVCGAVTGEEAGNVYEKFKQAGQLLAGLGYTPVLPTQIVPEGTARHDAMRICIGELTRCRHIYPLPCSYNSREAIVELQIAKIIHIPILNIATGSLEAFVPKEEEEAA